MAGMLQRTFEFLAFYGLPPPFPTPPVGGGAPSGPPISTRDGRIFPRTRGGRGHVGSSSQAPVAGDGESEAEASEEEAGGSSGSGSDSDTSDDAPVLLPRKRARMDPPARGH
ncbi:hypothetical protein LOK49_LG03G02203 [Camellia lanceoleosa]|uniref:Uncharacterized protein n=1 Tax=Camellia lanceoleosa TaxID=1840588 RepID=A0ACC0IH69_9ERIC|nr:hypothetical protein LOK49_LG03G02203 [Camellia lanceoleosa]